MREEVSLDTFLRERPMNQRMPTISFGHGNPMNAPTA